MGEADDMLQSCVRGGAGTCVCSCSAIDLLGDSVLDLDARVALDEVVFSRLRLDEELDRPCTAVARRLRKLDRISVESRAQTWLQPRCRRDLHYLLVPQLDGAVTLEEMDDIARTVGEDLDLDVAGACDELLDEY